MASNETSPQQQVNVTEEKDPSMAANNQSEQKEMSPEVKAKVQSLYQAHPECWEHFGSVVDSCDLIDQEPDINYDVLNEHLKKFQSAEVEIFIPVCELATALGFADRAVRFIRFVNRDAEHSFIYEVTGPASSNKLPCFGKMWALLMRFSHWGKEFRHQMSAAGFLNDVEDGLKCVKFIDPNSLRGKWLVWGTLFGTLHNCCKEPEIVSSTRQLNMAEDIVHFLSYKTMELGARTLAYLALTFIVETDEQLIFLKLDYDVLVACIGEAQGFLDEPKPGKEWAAEEPFLALAQAARLDCNRRLFVAKEGAMTVLMDVLQLQNELPSAQIAAATTLLQLAQDPANARIFQRDNKLKEILANLRQSPNEKLSGLVDTICSSLPVPVDQGGEVLPRAAEQVLADEMNILTIMGIGPVEYLLKQLSVAAIRGSNTGNYVTPTQLLTALKEMAADDRSYKQELFYRGVLKAMNEYLKSSKDDDDRMQCVLLLQELASHREYCVLMQAEGPIQTLKELAGSRVDDETTEHMQTELQRATGELLDKISSCLN